MLQRVQSIYIALAFILLVLCCSMPLATFEPQGMGFPSTMYTLALMEQGGGVKAYHPALLFIITILAELALAAAFLSFKNRRRQMALCSTAVVIEILWVVAYAVLCYYLREDTILHVKIAACFPLIAVILTLLARRGIRKDDELVRSVDRIR